MTAAALFSLQPVVLAHDWFGAPIADPIDVFLGVDRRNLWFGARCGGAPRCADAMVGDFVEGLWEHDVVEIFAAEEGSRRYQEFNLSPKGAWWTAAFSEYRERMPTAAMPGVRCFAEPWGSGWRAAMAIPLDELSIRWDLLRGRLNVTAVQGEPNRFVTLTDLGGGEPDFHRAEKFTALPRAVLADSGRL